MSKYLRWGIVLLWMILVFVNDAGPQSAGAFSENCPQCSNNHAHEILVSQNFMNSQYANHNASTPFFSPITNGVSDCPITFEEQVILLINVERSNAGLSPLALDIRLQSPARWFSNDLAINGFQIPPHNGSDGSTPATRVTAAGYSFNFLGENATVGTGGGNGTPEAVVGNWMLSASHRDNILGADYTHIGVGHTNTSGQVYDDVVVADFGSTSGPRQAPPASCDPGFFQAHFPFVTK